MVHQTNYGAPHTTLEKKGAPCSHLSLPFLLDQGLNGSNERPPLAIEETEKDDPIAEAALDIKDASLFVSSPSKMMAFIEMSVTSLTP